MEKLSDFSATLPSRHLSLAMYERKNENHQKFLTLSIFQTKRILLVTIILTEKYLLYLQVMNLSFSNHFKKISIVIYWNSRFNIHWDRVRVLNMQISMVNIYKFSASRTIEKNFYV